MARAFVLLLGLLGAALALSGERALAHAMLEHASPAVGSRLDAPPERVRLALSEQVEEAFSWIHVVNSAGERVDKDDTAVDPSDGGALSVSLGMLPPGLYRVYWHVVSLDTHVTEGDFKFEVGPPAQ